MTCEWCGADTDETGRDNACMIAHCLDCITECRACQDDIAQECAS